MIFAKERAEVICAQLKKQYLKEKLPVRQWEMKKGNFITPEDAAASPQEWLAFDSDKDRWYGPDEHYWFKTSFTVPDEMHGKTLWMLLHTQIDEWDDGKNPQFLLFVDGKIMQGLDMNHRDVLLTESAVKGKTYDIQIAAYTGTLHSEFHLMAEMAELVPSVYRLYYDIAMPLQAWKRMEKDPQTRLKIEKIINDTINLIDFRKLYSKEYFDSVESAGAYIRKALYTDMAGFDDIIATCIGHTHIDVAWWWTVAQTREKVARSFATVLKLMDEFPDYKFMSSQPVLYAFVKERYPELYAEIKQRVKEMRWETEGGMWLEADCNLTSGESLVRQFLYGKQFFKEEFGVDNRILWLPDVFGYSGALPQICKKCGIDYFMTTKLSWNQFNKIPFDTFNWRGIDGSEVLTHFISTVGVGQSAEKFFTTYNGLLHPDSIMGAWERYQQKELDNDILIAYGYGDGGGGPTREMLEIGSRMEKGVKGIPRVRYDFSRRYFDELKGRVAGDKRLPTWVGEFYFEYHRGTYTSMARNKRSNRKSELMLMDLELLSVLSAQTGMQYPAEPLEKMWKTVLLNQFHDILPGSSIHEVYEVTKAEYTEIDQEGRRLISSCLAGIAGSGEDVVLFNTLGSMRDDMVTLANVEGAALRDENGQIFPMQKIPGGSVAYIENLPSKGYKSFQALSEAESPSVFQIDGNAIETPFYKVSFNADGNIVSLYDKRARREVLKQQDMQGNLFRMYEDKPIYYDNWDIDIFYTEKFWDITEATAVQWIEQGPVRATLHIEREFASSKMKQDIHFYSQSPRIDFVTWVDWQENQHLLKVLFPVDLNTDEASFDIQFGNVKRKTHKNTSWDQARFETCAHKWMDVSEGGYGLSLLNDCKYGYSVDDGVIGLTLIKSGIEPNPVADQEEHFFTYALLPHQGGWQQAETPKHAANLNQPVYAVRGAKCPEFSFASTNLSNAVLETVKRAEDGNGVILRVYEDHNTRSEAEITLHKNFSKVYECDLLENNLTEIPIKGNQFSLTLYPFEIKTFRVIE